MRRRQFLKVAGFGAASWLARRALADATVPGGRDESARPPVERGHLAKAVERARAANRPVLVIVIPSSDAARLERGRALGDFIEHATDDQLSPFAYAELVCVPIDELRAATPVEGEPLFVRLPPVAQGFAQTAPADYPRLDPRSTAKRIEVIAARLESLVAPQVHLSMNGDGRRIAEALRKRAPDGSHWARRASCGGVFVEEWSPPGLDGCDMVVPHDRFLWFYGRPRSTDRR
jgi:hypothetical protein